MKSASLSILVALASLCLTGTSGAQTAEGLAGKLTLDPQAWPRLQGRLQLSTLDSADRAYNSGAPRLLSASLLGDYYLTGSLLGPRSSGGLRATSGLLMGPMSHTLGAHALYAPSGLSVQRLSLNHGQLNLDSTEARSTLPYIGIGYTGQDTSGHWSFKADFGLVGLDSKAVRLGRSPGLSPSLDDLLRDLRFKPVIQVGLNYAF